MKKHFAAIVCLFILGGCATKQPMSFEQMTNALAENQAAATRNYSGKTPKEVMMASQKVLFLLDPTNDMKFDVSENKIYAKRMWLIYVVLMSAIGLDQYNVSVSKTATGTQATLAYSSESVPLVGPPNVFKKNLEVGSTENPADFMLFHDRVEYVLGVRNKWTSCDEAKARQKDPSKFMFLCDSVGLENVAPDDSSVQQLN